MTDALPQVLQRLKSRLEESQVSARPVRIRFERPTAAEPENAMQAMVLNELGPALE